MNSGLFHHCHHAGHRHSRRFAFFPFFLLYFTSVSSFHRFYYCYCCLLARVVCKKPLIQLLCLFSYFPHCFFPYLRLSAWLCSHATRTSCSYAYIGLSPFFYSLTSNCSAIVLRTRWCRNFSFRITMCDKTSLTLASAHS